MSPEMMTVLTSLHRRDAQTYLELCASAADGLRHLRTGAVSVLLADMEENDFITSRLEPDRIIRVFLLTDHGRLLLTP